MVRLPLLPLLSTLVLGACAAGTATPAPTPAPVTANGEAGGAPQPALRWPVRTVPHMDLWLHGFAMLSQDSAAVPLYRRGYRDSITVVKNQRNLLTALDGNREALSRGLQRGGGYLNAQFLPFAYPSWDVMRAAAERFVQIEGDPQRAGGREAMMQLAPFASVFTTKADREWLRLYLTGLQDEQVRFFEGEQRRLLRERAATISAVDSLWQQVYRVKFERFLNNTSQRQGDMLLSLPIGGEGRTGQGYTGRPMVAVTYPARAQDAVQVLYVFAHEITGSLVGPAVADNTTPAEQRAGTADRYVSIGQVQAGALLLTRIAPELLTGYQRYYLQQVGKPVGASTNETSAAFAQAFTLPSMIRDALARQIDIVLDGI